MISPRETWSKAQAEAGLIVRDMVGRRE